MENDRGAKERRNERKRTRSITRTPFARSRNVRIPRPHWCGASLQRVFYDVSRRTRRPCPTSRRLFRFRFDRRTRRWKISFDPVTGAAIAKSLSTRFKRTLHSVEVSNRRVRRSCDSREWTASRYAETSNEVRTRSVYAFSRNKTIPIRICGSPWRVGDRRCLAAFPQTGLNSLLEN